MPAATAFPSARFDRAEPLQILGAPGGAAVAAPTVRLWPFQLEEVNPGDRRAASPFFRGPAVIDHIWINAQNDNTNPKPTISLFYGPTVPLTGNAVIPPGPQLGTPVFTDGVTSTETANVFQVPIHHLTKLSGDVLTLQIVLPLRFPIMLDQFQLLVQMGTSTAGSEMLSGYIRVLENVPPEQLPNFL